MKIIDLLNKIANGKIDYTNMFDANVGMGYCDINEYFEKYPINENYLNVEIVELLPMNDEVEIIEEKKLPEKLIEPIASEYTYDYAKKICHKINEIIDYIKSKGDE